MATLGSAAQFLSRDALAMWLLETAPYKNQIAKIWPFMPIDGPALKVARQALIAVADFGQPLDYNADIGADDTSAPAANVTFTPGVMVTRYRISYSSLGRFNVNQDLDAVEAALAIRRLMYAYFRMMDQNSGAAGTFSTLTQICATGQKPDLNGAALTLTDYDTAYFAVTAGDGRPNAIMSNSAQVKRYLSLMRAAGLTPEFIECEWPDPIRGTVRAKQLSLYGTPWYANDLIEQRTVNSQLVSNIYFMVLGANGKDANGPYGVTGIIPKDKHSSMFMRKESNMVYEGATGSSELNVDTIFTAGLALGQENALYIILNGREGA